MLVQPVCTTEIGRLALKYDDLKAKGVKLATLSADPVRVQSNTACTYRYPFALCAFCCSSMNLLEFRCQATRSGWMTLWPTVRTKSPFSSLSLAMQTDLLQSSKSMAVQHVVRHASYHDLFMLWQLCQLGADVLLPSLFLHSTGL